MRTRQISRRLNVCWNLDENLWVAGWPDRCREEEKMNWFLRLNPHCDLNSYSASGSHSTVVPHSPFMDTIIVALCYHISHTIAATATLQYFSKVLGIRYSFYFSFHDKRGRRYECEKASHCSQPQYYTPTQAILQSVGQ